jgi:Tfp pilus assembly protein PilF
MRAAPAVLTVLALGALLLFGRGATSDARAAADSEVLARLPRRSGAAAELARRPRDLELAVRVAREDIERARAEADPRWLGRAQAALRPWWGDAEPPHEVLILRATIRQSNHEFEAALADLALALRQDPEDPQAWLTRAVLQQVRGDRDGARASCRALGRLASELVVAACAASVDAGAEPRLARALERAPAADPALRAWALGILGELAGRRGDVALAESRLTAALALTPRDSYLLAALADLWLEHGRPREAVPLLAGEVQIDNLLLRLAIAETAAGAPDAAAHTAELGRRYAAAQARGDRVHLREQARYELELAHRPRVAFALAHENWTIQREAADARILVDSSVAVLREAAR